MLINDLKSIINILEQFIETTYSDIEDIKQAKHNIIFERNSQKEDLLKNFNSYKMKIDKELLTRSKTKKVENLLNASESKHLDIFKNKLQEFAIAHKKFSKIVFSVSNFYTNLMHRVTQAETQIGYEVKPNAHNNYLQLKG